MVTLLGYFVIGVLLMGLILLLFLVVVPDHPNVWTDGSLVLDKVAGISCSGAGFFADHAASFWDVRSWGQVDTLRSCW